MMNVFKKSLYALCFSLILFSDINAQEETKPAGFCGTAPQKTQWLKQYQRDISKFEHLRGKSMIYLPLTVSVLTNNDGSSNYSTARVLEQLCQLNEDYKVINIYFYLASPVRTIRNSNMNNHKTYEQVFDSLFFKYNVEKTINVYFTNNAAENCGYDIPGTGMVLAKGCMGATSHTWAHEMGHELSLPHTFLGWESTDYNAAKPTPADIDGFPVEKLDKSNCIDAGDGFCDTPPDYLSSRWTCNAQGKSPNTLKDPNGATFQVDGTFFMAYPNDVCMNRFSVQQMDAMRANALSEKIDMLSTALDTKPIKDTITLISPSDEAVINSDSVTFTWSKVPNATRYYFEVARNNKMTQNPIGYDLEDNHKIT
jgi:hypothetical protein